MALKFLPQARWGTVEKSVASRDTLNRAAKSPDERQLTVAADNAPIRIIYGTDRIGAQIANVLLHGNYWVFQCVWGEGECDAIEEVTINDAALPAGTLSIHYAGTAGQTADPWMVAAFAAKGQTYVDALTGICYSVLKVLTRAIDGFPQITARIRGRKVQALYPFTLTDRVTFTRASTRTYFGSDGLLKTAAINEWPLEYDPVTLLPIGRSVWEARTNLLTYSEQFDNAAWSRAPSTLVVLPNAAIAPDGTLTADVVLPTGINGVYKIVTVVSATTYTASCFLKSIVATGNPRVSFGCASNPATGFSVFDLVAGTVVSNGANVTSSSITPVGNGWFLCTVAYAATGTSNGITVYGNAAGDQLGVWGAQLEAGAFATPYIQTEAATVTRAADVAVMTGTNFSDWYNQSEGTFVTEAVTYAPVTSNRYVISADNGTVAERVIALFSASKFRSLIADNSVTQADMSSVANMVSGVVAKTALAYAVNNFAASTNGVVAITAVSGTLPTIDRLNIGSDFNNTEFLNGHIRSITYYPARLSDAELQTLSASGASYLDASVEPTLVLDFVNQTHLISRTQHTSNPSRALADFLRNDTFGASRSVDWASVVTAALANDEVVGGQPRRKIGLTIDAVQDVYQWADVLRTYAGCWVVPGSNGLKLITDRPAAVVASYDHDNGDIMAISALRRRPVTDAPTVMIVRYTDTSVVPWKEAEVTVYAPGVLAGTTEWRESSVSLPGIHSKAQAYREATERLNKLTLSDLSFTLDARDLGIAIEVGDVVAVTHPVGLAAKQMRVTSVAGTLGRHTLSLTEYDPAAYSDAVQTEPTSADTDLPDPGAPVPVTGLTLAEEVFQQQNGTRSSRIRATWTAPDFPVSFLSPFLIRVMSGGAVVFTGTAETTATSWASPAVQEGVAHQVDVITASRTGAVSSAASESITPAGKQLIPGNVPSLTGFEVGGEVRLAWEPAVDLDIWRYEVRYVATAGTWADSTLLDRPDSLRLVTRDVPAGTWDFLVKAIDSVGNYSTTEARKSITVTLDSAAFLVDSHDFTTPTLSNMVEYKLGRTDAKRRFVTDDGVAWNTKFSAAMNTYSNPLLSYSTTASSLTTESNDFGLSLSGNWRGEMTVTDLVGAADQIMDIGPDGSSWTPCVGMTAKDTARFARLRAVGTIGEVFIAELPTATVRIDAVPRTEDGTSTSSATLPTTITLSGSYAAVKSIGVMPTGTAARIATVDNIVVGATTTFDVYVFDAAGTQVANGFQWTFNGV